MKPGTKTTLRPFKPIKPGEILEEALDAKGWTSVHFACITGRPSNEINEILAGKNAIAPAAAVVFSRTLGTRAEYWLNLEAAFRLASVRRDPRNV